MDITNLDALLRTNDIQMRQKERRRASAFEVHVLLMNCVIRCRVATVEIRFRANSSRRDSEACATLNLRVGLLFFVRIANNYVDVDAKLSCGVRL